ncbi:glycoside hydrolase family 16 protein [Thalassotalea sp. PP2-459]|uniref:glycoside hydrolase family 16 protein n=1 Tax=Thalassotalea sp. PP2-459 TaxID=1742724 RepID=UPI000944EC6E|nr:glycoside hydrolase family 16 protein [Thalassotalea sp. PP2-459]OKY26264.1 glycosyl hydrolase family 16 [Thalassotalea sp. PP2-459]
MITTIRTLKTLLASTAAAALIGCGGGAETSTTSTSVEPTQPVSDWEMVWNDEFDIGAIDSQKWNHEVNCVGGGNNEKQCYTDNPENSYIEDGILHIVALPAEESADLPYTSARLNTKYKGDFKYGRFEVRAKLPSGQGSWPAFWMLPTDEFYGGWPKSGEIDIMEAVNLKVTNADGEVENNVHGTLHYGKDWPDNSSSGRAYQLPAGVNPADDFHTYAIEWQEGEIRWYVDDYLYQTQRRSTVRYNSKDEPVGLSHRGWFTEFFDQGSGELTTHWDNSPFDQEFHLLLNLAVGGDWPENVNNLGIDASAFADGQHFEIDYVRVFQCQQNPDTGKGCETVRGGYDSLDDALEEGEAPIPSPPSTGVPQNLTIFDGTANVNWPAWDCCGGSTPMIVEDADQGDVMEFMVGATPTVNGFTSREEFITDPAGKPSPFDASPIVENGTLSFMMKAVSLPNTADAPWLLKVESQGASTAAEISLSESIEGVSPVAGQWQTYTFSLQTLADAGLDLSAVDVVMIFPAWGSGEGAVYRVANLTIGAEISAPSFTVFTDEAKASWPLWDCCGGSTPLVVIDEDDAHGAVAEFSIGATPTVMGFASRAEFITTPDVEPEPFDASAILSNGVIQFDMKVTSAPNVADAAWIFKVESDNASTAAEVELSTSVEGVVPTTGQWQTYTFNLADLANAGLDVSAIDVLMIFPAWGSGEGAIYRVDNVKMYDPNATSGFSGHVLFADQALEQWSIWDCCGGTTPTVENDDTEHGLTAEFVIGATPTVMGIMADDDVYLDASSLLLNGVVQFEMKVESAPNDSSAAWLFKIEAGDTTTAVELELTASQEGVAPVVGQWQTYTFSLQDLFDAGLDISQIDVIMVFPAWGSGEGAVYRLDNVMIYDPSSVPQAQTQTISLTSNSLYYRATNEHDLLPSFTFELLDVISATPVVFANHTMLLSLDLAITTSDKQHLQRAVKTS